MPTGPRESFFRPDFSVYQTLGISYLLYPHSLHSSPIAAAKASPCLISPKAPSLKIDTVFHYGMAQA